MYTGFITRIKNLRKHENADRLLVGECFQSTVIVSLDYKEDQLGLYLPIDGKLGLEFATQNKLLREKDEMGNSIGGYLDPEKRNIRALRLRGEMSDGLFLPLDSLRNFCPIETLKEGDAISYLNGVLICEKYIPQSKSKDKTFQPSQGKGKRKALKASFPHFQEHRSTNQLAYHLNQFREGDTLYLSLKLHGTSGRTGNLIKKDFKKQSFLEKLLRLAPKPIESYEIISGTRRVILSNMNDTTGYYGTNDFRKVCQDRFEGKLQKNETVYYEIVGASAPNSPIMSDCSNKLVQDKEFSRQYGERTRFSYGCDIEKGEFEVYIYRMTLTNSEGYTIDYPWELVQLRASQMGIKVVPTFEKFLFTTREDLLERVNKYVDGPDPIGKTHVREGVVVRIDNREVFSAYKAKGFNFKVVEGLVKDLATEPDMEESQESEVENA